MEEIFRLFHEEQSSSSSTVFQGTEEVSLCLLPHHHARTQGTVALPPLLEDITDVGAIIAELSHNFHHFPYLFFYP